MRNESQSKVIEDNPIGNGLDAFYLRNLTLPLLFALQSHTVSGLLLTNTGRGTLRGDLLRLISAAVSDDFNFDHVKPLLKSALTSEPDTLIWDQVYVAVTESTPPPRPIASSLQQTPWLRNTSSFANSSEHRKYVDDVLKEELGSMYVGLRHFHNTYFGGVVGLDAVSEAFFDQCIEGSDPLFEDGWKGWPEDANQDDVLSWFSDFSDKLAAFADGHGSISTHQHRRRPLAQPNKPIQGSTGERKLDVGFVKDTKAGKDSRCHWSQILVPGELKSNPSADKASMAWLDLGRYAREVLTAQDTRRFVLGFTICGSLMRVWAFDRLGGIASEQFDINKDGRQFVSTILGFLWMNEEQLGFDPTIMTANGERFIEVNRNGSTERIIIDKKMQRAPCIAGRATTCWKAHPEGQPEMLLVIKDSWQYPERDEEGYGMPIYKASSRSALLAAFERCIEGHESLHRAGLLHRDVSINNLMINEDDDNPSWPAFVIDLDLAIKESREAASGAKGKTGTRAFMAIGALLGEQHSFMHDLESFFWVLFWICIHYNGPGENRVVQEFDKWNYVDMKELAKLKLGTVAKEGIFLETISDNFTQHYEPLIPLLNGLRKLVFPRDKPWEREDEKLYSTIREILRRDWEAYSTD
ncbi:Non-specific serine/threonine protein kinase [Fusarium keratoplasticum]|nr:Non-specific serine/threonine protein kinase [Fusarium keratoplasticum]